MHDVHPWKCILVMGTKILAVHFDGETGLMGEFSGVDDALTAAQAIADRHRVDLYRFDGKHMTIDKEQ